MIDTLKLNLADTTICDNANIMLQPGEIDLNSGLQSEFDLFVTKSKKIVRGKKAFINTDFFNLTIIPKLQVYSESVKNKKVEYYQRIYGRAADGSIEADRKELNYVLDNTFDYNSNIFLQTSLPKINSFLSGSNTYNLLSLNPNEIKDCIKFISNSLSDYGILTDLDAANISRIDLFNNIQTSFSFSDYSEIFRRLNLSKKNLSEFAGETFLFKNKSSQFTIYDKTKELFLKHKITVPANYMRFENRFLNKRKVFNSLGNNDLKSILNTNDFKNIMINAGNELFKTERKININITDNDYIYQKLSYLKNNNRYWLNKFFYEEGLSSVLEKMSKFDLLFILKQYLTKNKFIYIRKKINDFDFSNSIFSNSKLVNLYDEIKEKYFESLAA